MSDGQVQVPSQEERLAARLAATQAACPHRFQLVGYRHRRPGDCTASDSGHGFSLMDAVLVCHRCTAEYLAGVTQTAPAPIIPMPGGPNDVAYWSSQSARRFVPLEALSRITDAVVSLGFGPGHSVGNTVLREVRALRA